MTLVATACSAVFICAPRSSASAPAFLYYWSRHSSQGDAGGRRAWGSGRASLVDAGLPPVQRAHLGSTRRSQALVLVLGHQPRGRQSDGSGRRLALDRRRRPACRTRVGAGVILFFMMTARLMPQQAIVLADRGARCTSPGALSRLVEGLHQPAGGESRAAAGRSRSTTSGSRGRTRALAAVDLLLLLPLDAIGTICVSGVWRRWRCGSLFPEPQRSTASIPSPTSIRAFSTSSFRSSSCSGAPAGGFRQRRYRRRPSRAMTARRRTVGETATSAAACRASARAPRRSPRRRARSGEHAGPVHAATYATSGSGSSRRQRRAARAESRFVVGSRWARTRAPRARVRSAPGRRPSVG